jgi:hypothetical protein
MMIKYPLEYLGMLLGNFKVNIFYKLVFEVSVLYDFFINA